MKEITRETLKRMIDEDVDFLLIDARTHKGFGDEHLPGAISIPADHMGEHLMREFKKNRTIVTYCSSLECESSAIAGEKLETYGFKKVLRYKGGLKDWKEAGYPVERQ